MIDLVAKMYFAFQQKGLFRSINYYDLPNGRCSQTDLNKFSNEDLVCFINLHFDLKIQLYLSGANANLNSEKCNYVEKCGIARTLIDWYQRGIPLQDKVLEERRRLQEEKRQRKSKKKEKREKQKHKKTGILDSQSVVSDYYTG